MSFIAKSPLNIPEIGTTPPLPMPGTRGLFAREDGWYEIASDGTIRKLSTGGDSPISPDAPIHILEFENGLRIESRDDGIYLVDPNTDPEYGNEIELYRGGFDSFAFHSELASWADTTSYSEEAGTAECAICDEAGNNILETYATKAEAGSGAQKIIKFENGLSIESREDGIYLVDEEQGEEIILFSGGYESYVFRSEFSGYSDFTSQADSAIIAYEDDGGRTLKGTDCYDYGDVDDLGLEIEDAVVLSYGTVGMIHASVSDSLPIGFLSALHFTTPSDELAENYSDFPDTIYFKGDSVVDGRFVPESGTRYTVVFFFDGNLLEGIVSGMPAPSVSGVNE